MIVEAISFVVLYKLIASNGLCFSILGGMRLTSSYYVTKVLVNASITEIEDFRAKYDSSGNPRYKLRIRVVDGTSTAFFLLWDRESVQLIGKTARQLRERLALEYSENEFPDELEDLVGQKALFRIHIKEHNISENDEVFSVTRLTDDQVLIGKYKLDKSTEDSVSENKVSTPVKTSCKSKRKSTDDLDITELDSKGGSSIKLSTIKIRNIVKVEKEDCGC
ncbi:uncharacterized protein LOC127804355 [Diospyros lotus]|uniref:uncharacterized protein LOC127804355 n=1 Tax=Diospyros lotus TaxID=55363 RepID=UPI00225B09DE|nr:uncharacterized protein LOC127804355 [Diospyros lotus]